MKVGFNWPSSFKEKMFEINDEDIDDDNALAKEKMFEINDDNIDDDNVDVVVINFKHLLL